MRKFILAILGVLLIVLAIYFGRRISQNKKTKKPVPAKVIKTVFVDTVKNGLVKIVIPANGSLTAKRRIELFSEVQGIFRSGSKLFRAGQIYNSGQMLIRIDATEYYASVQSAKSNFYNSLVAIMPDLKLDYPDVFNTWQAYLNSFDLNKTTPELPKMSSDKENYFITGRGIVTSYYNVKNLEQRLGKYNIRAPFRGILTEALVTEGSLIRNGQKLGEYIDNSVYEMEVALGKSYASVLKVGEPVALNNLDNTESYTGKVSRINGSVDPTTQTIGVFIEVKDSKLKEGMYLEALLNGKQEANAIEVSRSLLLENNEIFVLRDSLLDIISVKPVYFGETKVVLKNIPDGTQILTRLVPGGHAGMLVKPYVETSNPE